MEGAVSIMLITIHDNQMNKVGFLSNEVPEIPSFSMIPGIDIWQKEQQLLALVLINLKMAHYKIIVNI